MVNLRPSLLKPYRGVLSLIPETDELSLIDESGRQLIVHETPRTRGLRNFLWEAVTLVGWLHREENKSVLEVIDFSSQEDPPEVSDFEEIEPMTLRNARTLSIETGFGAA